MVPEFIIHRRQLCLTNLTNIVREVISKEIALGTYLDPQQDLNIGSYSREDPFSI